MGMPAFMSWLCVALYLVLLPVSAKAESAALDCGDMSGYQKGSPWPAFKGCSTRISQSLAFGPDTINLLSTKTWNRDLGAKVGSPVVAADGTIYVNAGSSLFAYTRTGTRRWEANVGGDTLSGLAIGADGTVYLGAGSNLVAVNPNGTLKWTYAASMGASIISAPLIGPDGTVYFADNIASISGNVYAIAPSGARRWSVPFGPVTASILSSGQGTVLYVGSSTGALRALSASNGSTLWDSPISFGSAGTGAVGDDGTLYIGGTLGTLYALSHIDGSKLWEVGLGAPVIASPAIGLDGTIYVATAGIPPFIRGKLVAVSPAVQSPKSPKWSRDLGAYVAGSLVIDAGGSIYLGLMDNTVRSYTSAGVERWRYTTGDQIISTPAITADGSIVIGSRDNKLYAFGDGSAGTNITKTWDRFPWVALPLPGEPTGELSYCRSPVTQVAGQKRYGVDYGQTVIPGFSPTAHYLSNFRITVQTPTDPDCSAHLCDADEKRLTSAQETALFADNAASSNTLPTTLQSLPSFLQDYECDAVETPARCGFKPTGVNWNAECNPQSASACPGTQVCTVVCPKQSGSSLPQTKCDTKDERFRCVAVEDKNCTGLTGPANPDPLRPDIKACHELRECARNGDRLTASDIEPSCGGTSCSAPTAPKSHTKPADPAFPGIPSASFWSPSLDLCSLSHQEKAAYPDESGKNTASGGKPKAKKWGVDAQAKINTDFAITPKPGLLFRPYAKANGRLYLGGRVMDKGIPVLEATGDAVLNPCTLSAAGGMKLFGHEIAAMSGQPATYGSGSDASASCEAIFSEAAKVMGEVKEALIIAERMYILARDAQKGSVNPTVTQKMCLAVRKETGIDCNRPSKQMAANVINAYINRYNTAIANVQAKYDAQVRAAAKRFTDALPAGLSRTAGIGFDQRVEFVDLSREFELAAASAQFPIGPISLVLEVHGFGTWGVKGDINYGAKLFSNGSTTPEFFARATVQPRAGLKVDVFVGAGFEFGIGGASAGIGGDVTLVDVKAPVSSTMKLKASPVVYDDKRGLPSEISSYVTSQIPYANRPALFKTRHQWNMEGALGAGARLELLYGDIDVRLRVRFAFFSKTWKKKLAKFEGLPPKTYEWTGKLRISGDSPIVDGVDLKKPLVDVLQPMALPAIPRVDSTTTWFPRDFNAWSPNSTNEKVKRVEEATWSCNPPPVLVI
jgi:outer membrane protein assembly factor BamB